MKLPLNFVPSGIPYTLQYKLRIVKSEMAQVVSLGILNIWYQTVANEPKKITASCS